MKRPADVKVTIKLQALENIPPTVVHLKTYFKNILNIKYFKLKFNVFEEEYHDFNTEL